MFFWVGRYVLFLLPPQSFTGIAPDTNLSRALVLIAWVAFAFPPVGLNVFFYFVFPTSHLNSSSWPDVTLGVSRTWARLD